MKKEYKEIRKINADSLQSLCISKRWYTRGDNAAYNHLLYDLAELLDCWVEFCAENGFQTNSVDYVERVCE